MYQIRIHSRAIRYPCVFRIDRLCDLDQRTGVLVAFSLDEEVPISASPDKTVRLWIGATTGAWKQTLRGHGLQVNAVAFFTSASYDCTVRLWDATTSAWKQTPPEGHSNWVDAVAFSPDGKFLASASSDKTMRLWDTEPSQLDFGLVW